MAGNRCWIWPLLFLLLLQQHASAGGGIERLRSLQGVLKTAEGRFTQVTYIRDLERSERFGGLFYMKAPDMMKWRYTAGSSDVVYIREGELIIHQPAEGQAFVAPVERYGLGRMPLRILLDVEGLEQDFDIEEKGRGRLILRPKGGVPAVESIELALSEEGFPLERILVVDRYGNSTEITLRDVKLDADLPDSLFLFTPPEGTVLIRQ